MQPGTISRQRYASLLREFTSAQFMMRDQHTTLGLLWSFLHPLLMMALLYVMFDLRFANKIDFFAVYLIIGLVHLAHFSNATANSINALRNSRQLVINTTFPAEVLVVSMVLANTIEFIVSLLICIGIAGLAGIEFTSAMLWLPLVVLMQTMLVMWVSLLLATLCAFVADIGHIYQLFLRMLIFITPVFYSLSFLGNGLALRIVMLNPLTHLMTFSRSIIIDGIAPSLVSVGYFLAVNGLLLIGALKLFRRMEPRFAERL